MYISLDIEKLEGLPLLSEQNKIFDLARAYLHLPYSVAEYGCGKRADVTTRQLYDLGIHTHAVRYGMIIEPDMSSDALAERDHTKRPFALTARNPLASLVDFDDEILLEKIQQLGATIDLRARTISLPPYYTGDYILHTDEVVAFNLARSHIFLILRFYDEQTDRIVQRVLDPMLDDSGMFELADIRYKLNCPAAVLFSSEIGGYFSLMEEHLTPGQWRKLSPILKGRRLRSLDGPERCRVIRLFLNDAPVGSIGDPATWTYGNNLQDKDLTYNAKLAPRDRKDRHRRRGQRKWQSIEIDKERVVYNIGAWSEDKLIPLADLVNLIRVHKSEIVLSRILKDRQSCATALVDMALLDELRGFGVRLRERIDRMAEVSRNERGEIDARAFTRRFAAVSIELIKQMNAAGVSVFMDKAGNIHGLLTDRKTEDDLKAGVLDIEHVTSKALGFQSHIDTVYDAGKYDGRLGVLSGIEVAHTLFDLRARDSAIETKLGSCPIMVSAYANEEMTYTGEDVSMPGSSAVAGTADIERIYRMTEPGGQTYREGLVALVRRLAKQQRAGEIELVHDLSVGPDHLQDPRKFLPRQAIERHCEQADVILKAGVPMAQVDVIMGIHQEDFTIAGPNAEEAVLTLMASLRTLNHDKSARFRNTRVTNGAVHKEVSRQIVSTDYAQCFVLKGKKNHAGATAPGDRFDPGIAAAKLVQVFRQTVRKVNTEKRLSLEAVAGDFNLYAKYETDIRTPAAGRNAIPDTATISLGVYGDNATPEVWGAITLCLERHLRENTRLNDNCSNKDLSNWYPVDVPEIGKSGLVVLTLDMRDGDARVMQDFLLEKDKILDNLRQRYGVQIRTTVEQTLPPLRLDHGKNVSLILDGSIGGSHNPSEAEYPEVVLMGTILQLAATLQFMENPDRKIFDLVEEILPRSWREKIGDFSSGALHDACQIAVGIAARRMKTSALSSIIE
jgi:hypothetical protein